MLGGKPLILVVDDENDARVFLYSLLENEGYAVGTCTSAAEAIRYVARQKPELVVSDVRMPETDGLQLLAEVKRVSPKTRVILLSAYADWPMYNEAIQKGGDDVILKPCTNAETLRTIRRVLGEASSPAEQNGGPPP